ncbi:MAG: ABC transporter ATP-binding protein, partial [Clostridia bacterium]
SVGDEPFQHKSRNRMMELMSGGTTVLYVSHSLASVRELCNRVLWLEKGQVRMIGEVQEVCDAYQNS